MIEMSFSAALISYLVDLRDAVYDDKQRTHFMQTGAILHTPRC